MKILAHVHAVVAMLSFPLPQKESGDKASILYLVRNLMMQNIYAMNYSTDNKIVVFRAGFI